MPLSSASPFSPESPITEEERFFGREDLMEWIGDRFADGEHLLVVYGTPRIGKTSLLFRLRSRLEVRALPVYLDLQGLTQAPVHELIWQLATEVRRALCQGRDDALPEVSREAIASQGDYLHEVAFPAWRPMLGGMPLALLVDGLDLAFLQGGAGAELALRLQEMVRQERDLRVVLAVRGSSGQAKEPLAALRGLPQRDLDPLTEVQTEELLVGLARYQLGFDYDAIRRIHALSGGQPYLVHAFGAELYRRLAPFGQVTIHAVGDVVPAVMELTDGFFAAQWEALSREARLAFAAVGSLQGYRDAVNPSDIALALCRAGANMSTEVVERGLRELRDYRLMRCFSGAAYALRMEAWRHWLASSQPLDEVLHGKRPPRKERRPRPGLLAFDWGALLLWAAIALAVFIVARVWTSRNPQAGGIVPLPTETAGKPTPRPTATHVALPGRIAYMGQATAHDPWCIWTMRDNGTDPVRLTDGTSEDTMPAWSPDGSRLAFVSNRSGNRDIWVMHADGSGLQNITRSEADEWTPAWAPDGTAIAFASYRDGNWELYASRPDGSQAKRMTWSAAADYAPSWSPDGGRLAFVSERDGNPEIYVVNRDDSGLVRLTKNQVTDLSPRWSPDGQQIAFETYRDGNMEIYTMAADGSNAQNVSNQPESDEHGPAWSPDGRWITYYSNHDGSWDVFFMLADGSQKTNLTMGPAIEQAPVWQPRVQEQSGS